MREYTTTVTFDFEHGGYTFRRYFDTFPLVYLAMIKDADGVESINLSSARVKRTRGGGS